MSTYKKIWLGSDSHYSHANIINLCNRNFSSIYEHDRVLMENHNSLISNNDDYYFLGDFAYRCSAERVFEILKKLNGKIHMLKGNHDKPLFQAVQRGLLNDMLNSGKVVIFGLKAILEDPTIAISKMINIDGQLVFLSHYACRTWPSAFRGGTIHAFGHSHSNLVPFYKSMDVGCDVKTETHQRFFPWSWEEIKVEMDKVVKPFSEKEDQNDDKMMDAGLSLSDAFKEEGEEQ